MIPDVFAFASYRDWFGAMQHLSARSLADALAVRHWTSLQAVRAGRARLTPALATELSAALGHSDHQAAYLQVLVTLDDLRARRPPDAPEDLATWLRLHQPSLPQEQKRIKRLLRRESATLSHDVERLADAVGDEDRVTLALLVQIEQMEWERERLACLGRAGREGGLPVAEPSSDPTVRQDHQALLAPIAAALAQMPAEPRYGLQGFYLGVHQGMNAALFEELQQVFRRLEQEFAGRSAPGQPYVLHMGMQTQTRPFPAGAAPGLPVWERPEPLPDLVDRALEHHGVWLRACWPELERLARQKYAFLRANYRDRPLPVTAVVALIREVDPEDPSLAAERVRFNRLRSGDPQRPERLLPAEVARVSALLGADAALLMLMVLRDQEKGTAQAALQARVAQEQTRARIRQSTNAERLSQWFAPLLYELAQCSADTLNPAWAASVVWPPVPVEALTEALTRMDHPQLIRRSPAEVYARGLSLLRRPDDVPVVVTLCEAHARKVERVQIGLSGEVEDQPMFQLHGLRLHLPADRFGTARRRLEETLRQLQAAAEAQRGTWDRVVQCHFFLCPLELTGGSA